MPCLLPCVIVWWGRGRMKKPTTSTSACAARARRRSSTTDVTARRMTAIRDLLSYRLHLVANLLSRGAELRYRREFGVSLWEWRTIALLGAATEPLSLNHLVHAAGIHKSQMSRVVSGLAKRRIVQRAPGSRDARGVQLTLSKTGRR